MNSRLAPLILCLTISLVGAVEPGAHTFGEKPNIVLILIDDLKLSVYSWENAMPLATGKTGSYSRSGILDRVTMVRAGEGDPWLLSSEAVGRLELSASRRVPIRLLAICSEPQLRLSHGEVIIPGKHQVDSSAVSAQVSRSGRRVK